MGIDKGWTESHNHTTCMFFLISNDYEKEIQFDSWILVLFNLLPWKSQAAL